VKNLSTHVNWIDAVQELQAQGLSYVLVTVLGVRGSTPRDNGSKMVIAEAASYGSIGGGHLEYTAHEIAAEMLIGDAESQRLEKIALGASLGQCCGGHTQLLFEKFPGARMNIMLFGAGHVGTALAPVLSQLPSRLWWVDNRDAYLSHTSEYANTRHVTSDDPVAEVANMPAHSDYLIMTHNHQLDYDILQAVLERGDARYVGLIGSQTKWRRFQLRMQHRGQSPAFYEQVSCPVGMSAIPGKLPIEIAVSIAAELIALNHNDDAQRSVERGVMTAKSEVEPA
jgi:xanthine dehydrogenase accessory factor